MARPGGHATGFIQFEYSLSGKWLELLKEIAPGATRAAVLRDPAITAGIGQFAVIQSVASSIGVDVSPVNLRDAGEIERAVTAFARSANGGLVVTASALSLVHSELILALAARYKLPAIYPRRSFVVAGGLISYGFDALDVSFQQVVHPVLTEEAEVAETSDSKGEPDERAQECPSDATRSRANCTAG